MSDPIDISTADLCDEYENEIQVASINFRDFGADTAFAGRISTIKAFEDNSLVREAVAEPGEGRVLVIDSGGSTRRAMLGDMLAGKAVENGWSGVMINGCLRDSAAIAGMKIGVKALGTVPLKTEKRGQGLRDVPVRFADIEFVPGHWLYADADGIVVASRPLHSSQ